MVIDCESSLEFIENRFDSFLDFTYVINTKYYWCEKLWHPKLFFNNKYLPTSKSDIELNKWDKICVWTGSHHNMFEESTKIQKRCERLLNIIDNKPSSLLLVCMPNIKEYSKLDNRQRK